MWDDDIKADLKSWNPIRNNTADRVIWGSDVNRADKVSDLCFSKRKRSIR